MKSLVDLKKELKDGVVNNLYIFTGEENLIRKIYYQKIGELYGNIKYLESVQDLYKELEKKSLFQLKLVYVVYNDMEYLKQKEKVYERLIELSRKHCVVLIYDEIPEKSVFKKVFEDYITTFNYVTNDIAIKYVNKENHQIKLDFAKRIAYNCFNSYNNIVEEMNKYNHYVENHDDAIDAMKQAEGYASEVNAHELICDNYEYLSKVHSAQGHYKEAYVNLLNFEKKKEQLLRKKELVDIERSLIRNKLQEQKKEAELVHQRYQLSLLRRNICIAIVIFLGINVLTFLLVKQLKRKKDLQIAKAQKELADLKLHQQTVELEVQSEKLESTQSELTNFVLFLNSRNELLEKIRDMIKAAYKMNANEILTHLKRINTYILQVKKMEEENDCLTHEVEMQNTEFLNRLVQKHPGLTPGEKRLATFLRVNLSTKEISLLTGISVKAISMARYRLRKSLNLHPQEDIFCYLRNI